MRVRLFLPRRRGAEENGSGGGSDKEDDAGLRGRRRPEGPGGDGAREGGAWRSWARRAAQPTRLEEAAEEQHRRPRRPTPRADTPPPAAAQPARFVSSSCGKNPGAHRQRPEGPGGDGAGEDGGCRS
ncbi:hypothetical protein U9M48_029215 [Paspalum notatum var. saurae]|uniref:Uncharacterized protein n=1 Tax=Paspalum notatum var. saurae TaxID=547442 RepID=A0AAQ3TX41_PASNO